MRVLIDAHVLIWAVDEPARFGKATVTALQDPNNELLLSAGTAWELAIKVGLKKLTLSTPYKQWITKAIGDLDLAVLPISVDTPMFRQVYLGTIATLSIVYSLRNPRGEH